MGIYSEASLLRFFRDAFNSDPPPAENLNIFIHISETH